jgi:hypothetical protein
MMVDDQTFSALAAAALLIVVGAVTYAVGYLRGALQGAAKGIKHGFEQGWLAYRRRTDPNIPGGFAEHPTIRKQNERRWIKEAIDDLRQAEKYDREHWN